MESALRSLTKTPSPFPQAPAAAHHQPPLLPLPAQAPSPQHSFWSASRRPTPPRATKPGPSAPISVAAPPSKRKVAPAPAEEGGVESDSLYSVSPPPCCVPMPTSLLAAVMAPRKAPCAVEVVSGAGDAVDVGATDELRRLLRL